MEDTEDLIASRPEIEASVPSLIKIGDGDFHFFIFLVQFDMDWPLTEINNWTLHLLLNQRVIVTIFKTKYRFLNYIRKVSIM